MMTEKHFLVGQFLRLRQMAHSKHLDITADHEVAWI